MGTKRRFLGPVDLLLRLIGPAAEPGGAPAKTTPTNFWWIAAFSLHSASCLLMIAVAHYGGFRGHDWASPLLWFSLAVLYLPLAMRAAWPTTARGERVALLLLLAVATYSVKLLYAPTSFVHFDEFLHWLTAMDIAESHRLFLENSLLPISPLYPGLELAATAITEMTGLSIFGASVILLVVFRVLLLCALFFFYERVCKSPRTATVACLVYAGNSGFILFDNQFAYESLAVVLFAFALLATALFEDERSSKPVVMLGLVVPFFAALAVTHHMSAYFSAVFMLLLALLGWLGSERGTRRFSLSFFAAMALLLPIVWSWVQGNPSAGYLGPIVEKGSHELASFVSGASKARKLFVLPSGLQTPIWLRTISVVSLLLIVLGLSTGFMRSLAMAVEGRSGWPALLECLRLRWKRRWIVLLALISTGFPISVGFRLTSAGWEIGNRMGPFVFLGVGFVVAVSIVQFWQTDQARWWPALGVGIALTLIFVGGIITGWGVPAQRTPYAVSADASSVEPMGIDAALWTRQWLGQGNRFASDRVNQLLLATYGRQDIVTQLVEAVSTSSIFFAPTLPGDGLYAIRQGRIDYLLADLRLTAALPAVGHYYDQDEFPDGVPTPPEASSLVKFDAIRSVNRVFDNGSIVIFDVRRLRDAR